MNVTIRKMQQRDAEAVLAMMRVFYRSPAVLTDGSEEIFQNDVAACVGDSPYLEGFMMESAGEILGYAMIAKSFSTEFGKPCIWIEDLYVKESYRHQGVGSAVLQHITGQFPGCLFRLEVEAENGRAIEAYRKNGFEQLPYMEMILL